MATLKGINLTLLIGPAVPVPAPQPLVDALESAQVTVDASSNTTAFQLVFDTSKNSIITRTLLPAGYFDPLIRVIMICWINGIPDVLCDGVITQQHYAPSNQPGGSKLTITGEDLTRLMDLIDLTGDVPYPAQSAEKRVELILAKYLAFGIVTTAIPAAVPGRGNAREPDADAEGQRSRLCKAPSPRTTATSSSSRRRRNPA